MRLFERRSKVIRLMVGLTVGLTAATSATAAFDPRRAINNANWLAYPRYQEEPATGIKWPAYDPFKPGRQVIGLLQTNGFEAMRLIVDPVPFLVFDANRRDHLYRMLFDTVQLIQSHSLKVIIALAPPSQHPVWGADLLFAHPNTEYLTRYLALVRDMAERLATFDPDVTAFELVNEPRIPCEGGEQERWQNILGDLIKQARAGNPTIPLVVSGACMSAPEGLILLDAKRFNDPNLIYTFHYYEPFSFTHQGASFVGRPISYFDQIPYPAAARPLRDVFRHVENRIKDLESDHAERTKQIKEARQNLTGYYAWGHNRGTMDKEFTEIAAWAKRNDVPPERIFIGEFGINKRSDKSPGALCSDRAAWITAVRTAAEGQNFRWAFFDILGEFGALLDTKPLTLDPVILGSLGIGPTVACGN